MQAESFIPSSRIPFPCISCVRSSCCQRAPDHCMITPTPSWVLCQRLPVSQPSCAAAAWEPICQRHFNRRSRRQRVYPCQCSSSSSGPAAAVRVDAAAAALLDRYWESRGIFDESRRERLVAEARRLDHAGASHTRAPVSELPSLPVSRLADLLVTCHGGSQRALLLRITWRHDN